MTSVPILRRKHLWKFYATPWVTGITVVQAVDGDISQIGLPKMSELTTSPDEIVDEIVKTGSVAADVEAPKATWREKNNHVFNFNDDDVDWQPNRDRIIETEDQAAEFARRYRREIEKDEKAN